MDEKIISAVRRYRMLRDGDTVLLGLSGGADSMSLLHWLRFGGHGLGLRVTACHLNHCLRGAESDRDEQFVRSVCAQWDVPLTVRRVPAAELAREQKRGIEECARELRYAFFDQVADTLGKGAEASAPPSDPADRRQGNALGEAVKIATAHTLSDRVETMLFRVARGTGIAGLRSIPPVRGRIIRPLIGCTRAEVEAYCAAHEIPFVVDSTNLEPGCARNIIRLEAVPALRRVNSGFEQNAARLIESAAEDEAYLESEAEKLLEAAAVEGGYDGKKLAAAPRPVRKRAVRSILRQVALETDAQKIDEILKIIAADCGKINLASKTFAVLRGGVLSIEHSGSAQPAQAVSHPFAESTIMLADKSVLEIRFVSDETERDLQKVQNVHKNRFQFLLDCDKIWGNAVVRKKMDGDRLHISRRGLTKPLKKLFCELGLSAAEKSAAAVLADDRGVFAVATAAGIEYDGRVAAGGETSRPALVTLRRRAEGITEE